MTAEGYAQLSAWWRARPRALAALRACNTALTALGWLAYPLLLVLSALLQPGLLLRFVLVPGLGFALCTLLRCAIDEPRPYEQLAIDALIPKQTKGKSFPSRHVFSMTIIALSWLSWVPAAGAVLLAACVFMGYARVVGGVHFAHDVVGGAALAVLVAAVGYLLVAW